MKKRISGDLVSMLADISAAYSVSLKRARDVSFSAVECSSARTSAQRLRRASAIP
jgi:hypothetical protein